MSSDRPCVSTEGIGPLGQDLYGSYLIKPAVDNMSLLMEHRGHTSSTADEIDAEHTGMM